MTVPLVVSALVVAGNLAGMLDAYLTQIAQRHWKERRAVVDAIRTPEDARRRQAYIRETLTEALGGWPEKTPLRAQIAGTLEREGYRVEKLLYESLPGFKVTANVYVPTGAGAGPFPAVLGVAGHSVEGKAIDTYQRGWIGMVKRGFLVLAFDPPGQGERSLYWDAREGKSAVGIGTREHTMAGLQCLLTGGNIARYEIWDGIRGVDYLLTRKDVDPARLAVAGNSGGGTQSAYLAALEPRLAAAAPSCYITSWENMWLELGPQDAEQNIFGFIGKGLDFGDYLTAFGPKPVKMMTAIRDFFPIAGARATFRETARVFEAMGARDKIDMFEYDDTHGWSKPRREATYRWFEKWLHQRDDEGQEPEFSVEKPETLSVTATGQLATSGGSETVQSLNARAAEAMYPRRTAAVQGAAGLGRLVETRLAVQWPAVALTTRSMGEVGRDGYRIERVLLETEPGISVPGLLFHPLRKKAGAAAIVYLHPEGKAAAAGPGGEIERLVLGGQTVFAIDVRGQGESAAPRTTRGYTPSYQTYMRAYLLGRSLIGMQVVDVVRAAAYLRERTAGGAVTVSGRDTAGALALYAGILDPAVSVVTSGKLPTYLEMAKMPRHDGLMELMVHGVLKDFDFPDLEKALGTRYAKLP